MPASKEPKHVVCIGAGYVGGPTMAVMAKQCPHIKVTVFDIFKPRIDAWNSPKPTSPNERDMLPIFEPGLAEIVYEVRGRNLFFTHDQNVLAEADIIFISVNTPTKTQGIGAGRAADLTYIEGCSRLIAETVKEGHVIVVEKSTVPVRCSVSIQAILSSLQSVYKNRATFSILSSPEFLAEGTAINDLTNPDRVLIGGSDADAIATLSSVYENWIPAERIVTMNLWSSELSKLVANAFLAQRISSINSITPLCEKTGANILEVKDAISKDKRIGEFFLNPSVGFGGSCFQKDILNLVYLCESLGLHETAAYWEQVIKINDYQKERFYKTVVHSCFDTVRNKDIAIYGFAFKKNTGDTRESPATYMCARLLQEGAKLHIYDPKVTEQSIVNDIEQFINQNHVELNLARPRSDGAAPSAMDMEDRLSLFVRNNVTIEKCAADAAKGAAALLVLTEWDEFRTLDYTAIYETMQKPAFVFDGRLILDVAAMKEIGFKVFSIGVSQTSDMDSADRSFFFQS